MMARLRPPPSTTDDIDWREAGFLVRVVQSLVTPRADEAEFKRELEYLIAAAAALRERVSSSSTTGLGSPGKSEPSDRSECETEGAVLTLWRTPAVVYEGGVEAHNERMALDTLTASPSGLNPVEKSELARFIGQIRRETALLRADKPASTIAVESNVGLRRPRRV
jgi:hypothetical protein